jgi:CheY-like chemotaxis protein
LLVDDDAALRKVLGDFIESKGQRVAFASDGEEALTVASREPPAAALVDIMLPKLDGFELCRRLKTGTRPPKVLLMSGIYRTTATADDARRRFGADAFLAKPFAVAELWQLLEPLLDDAKVAVVAGSLANLGLAQLLGRLAAARQSGALHLSGPRGWHVIYVADGQPIAIESSGRPEHFEPYLIDPELRARLSEDERSQWAARHVSAQLDLCFDFEDGWGRFEIGAEAPASLPRAVQAPTSLYDRVVARLDDARLREEADRLGRHTLRSVALTRAAFEPLADAPARLVAAVGAGTTAEQALALCGLPPETALPALVALMRLGVLETVSKRSSVRPV